MFAVFRLIRVVFVFTLCVCVAVHVRGVAEKVNIVPVLTVNAAESIPVRDIVGHQDPPTVLEQCIALQRDSLALVDFRMNEIFGADPGVDLVVVVVYLVAHDDGAVVFLPIGRLTCHFVGRIGDHQRVGARVGLSGAVIDLVVKDPTVL